MTFIASVIAKKGVAIIADSLVTSSKFVIDYEDFVKYIQKKELTKDKDIKIETKEIIELFKAKASHTKDYEEKLFMYDEYTAITTAGLAIINSKRIEKIVNDAIKKLKPNQEQTIEKRVADFRDFVSLEIKQHLKVKSSIRPTIFIITHYSIAENKTVVYKLNVTTSSKKDLKTEGYEFIHLIKQPDNLTVVCDGQNRISERILFGDVGLIMNLIPKVVKKIATDFKISSDKMNDDYVFSLIKNKEIVTKQFLSDIKINKLTELSLQQAVDLACLLMKIEIDMQKYTENIPTVGGVIKLAVIDENKFRYVLGNEIVIPENF